MHLGSPGSMCYTCRGAQTRQDPWFEAACGVWGLFSVPGTEIPKKERKALCEEGWVKGRREMEGEGIGGREDERQEGN